MFGLSGRPKALWTNGPSMLSHKWVNFILFLLACRFRPFVGINVRDGNAASLPTTKRKKKQHDFDRDDNDAPILNDPSQMMARVMEPMVRQFMSIHYSESVRA
jgi:hypothetical protein